MEKCSHTFVGHPTVSTPLGDIDEQITPLIISLNDVGYHTVACCQGGDGVKSCACGMIKFASDLAYILFEDKDISENFVEYVLKRCNWELPDVVTVRTSIDPDFPQRNRISIYFSNTDLRTFTEACLKQINIGK